MDNKKYLILYPFSIIYRLATDLRNLLYNQGILSSKKFDIPLISVGNITVGGTGKTPHTEYIAGLLKKSFSTAVLSRGYMRKTKGYLEVKPEMSAEEAGDEPLLIARGQPGILVAVDGDRVEGVTRILDSHPGTEVIILDDAFQHRRIMPGLSILLTDFSRIISGDFLLPYGRLREKWTNSSRADIIIVTKSPGDLSAEEMDRLRKELRISRDQKLYFSTTTYGDPLPVFRDNTIRLELAESERYKRGAIIVTGIAAPGPLRLHLEKYFSELVHLEYPDHHFFNNRDMKSIGSAMDNLKKTEKYIITTSKDAVRLTEFANIAPVLKNAFYYVPVGISFLNDGGQEFNNLITGYVRKNKKNDRVP